MNKLSSTVAGCAAIALLSFAGAAIAANVSEAQSRYQQERAACISGASNQDPATCLKEAGAALQEAGRGALAASNERDFGHNRTARCAALPEQDRHDCAMRMHGQGSTSGSAQQGGILRELAVPVPVPARAAR
jgi:hypothetical protein